MDSASSTPSRTRVAPRYRRFIQDLPPRPELRRDEKGIQGEKEEEPSREYTGEPLLAREQRKRTIMGRGHRMFHRRQEAEPSNVLTVPVEVVATIDDAGNTVMQETRTMPPDAGLPTVPAVPEVPPFPTSLVPPSVPAFPFPSGVPSPSASEALETTDLVATTAMPAPPADFTSAFPTLNPSGIGINSTSTHSNALSTSLSNSLESAASTSLAAFLSSATFLSSSDTSSTAPFDRIGSSISGTPISGTSDISASATSTDPSSTDPSATATGTESGTSGSATANPTETLFPPGGGFIGENAPPGPAPTEATTTSSSSDDSAVTTPRIVGSVIGSLAGTAILLWLLLFLIKRHKRGRGRLQLTDTADNNLLVSSSSPMASRSVPSFLNRFSGASRATIDTAGGLGGGGGGERGFQRISGRKLPSAFSEGMTSEQFARGEGTLSGSSFYSDDRGFYGGTGLASQKEFGKEIGDSENHGTIGAKERIMPSPARTPVVHHPDDEVSTWGGNRGGGAGRGSPGGPPAGGLLSPPQSPNPNSSLDLARPFKPSLGRSHYSQDGSRSSRFTENV